MKTYVVEQVLKTQLQAKSKGYSDVLYLDAVENKYIEEVSSCNIFIAKVKKLLR
jgi:branched-chain amino acid aminotransferase